MMRLLLLVLFLSWNVNADIFSDHVPIRVNNHKPSTPSASPGDTQAAPSRRRPQFTHSSQPTSTSTPSQPARILELQFDHRLPATFVEPSMPGLINNASMSSINGTCSTFQQNNVMWQICPYGQVLRANVNEAGVTRDASLIGVFERWADQSSLVQLFTQGDCPHSLQPHESLNQSINQTINQSINQTNNQTTQFRVTFRCNETLSLDELPITQLAEIAPYSYQSWIYSKAACQFVRQIEPAQPISFKQLIDSTLSQSNNQSNDQSNNQITSTVDECLSAMLDVARFVENVETPLRSTLHSPDHIRRICSAHWRRVITYQALINQVDELMTQNWDDSASHDQKTTSV